MPKKLQEGGAEACILPVQEGNWANWSGAPSADTAVPYMCHLYPVTGEIPGQKVHLPAASLLLLCRLSGPFHSSHPECLQR